jgi:hypothetical protein
VIGQRRDRSKVGTVRAIRLVVGIAAAVVLFMLGSIFGLNGQQWGWWRWAAWLESAIILAAVVLGARSRSAPRSRGNRSTVVVAGGCGGALVVLSVAVMAHGYSDPYRGTLFWPHALALLAFVGLSLVVASFSWWARGRCLP